MTAPPIGLYREVPVSKGHIAFVSPEDFDRVVQYRWFAHKSGKCGLYARGRVPVDGGRKLMLLHRFITGLPNQDHIDRNGLNCTRGNFRTPLSQGHNTANQGPRNRTGFKGVRSAGKKF